MNTSLTETRFSKNTVYLGFDAFAGTKLQKAIITGNAEFIAKTAFGDNAQTLIYCNKGAGAESYAAENGIDEILIMNNIKSACNYTFHDYLLAMT